MMRAKMFFLKLVKSEKGEGAITYILLAAGLITILAFVFVPGLRDFAEDLVADLGTWFGGIDDNLFGTS